jgi:predicted DCC family thiol-disulfide oxidoreductase YuxK
MKTEELPITLYFDGHCPLCLREVRWLAGRARPDRLRLVDVHDDLALACDSTPPRESMLAVLHARTATGRWLTGVDATVAAWQAAGAGAWVVWLAWPGVRRLSWPLYRLFARHRHRLARWVGDRMCDPDCRQQAHDRVDPDRIKGGFTPGRIGVKCESGHEKTGEDSRRRDQNHTTI